MVSDMGMSLGGRRKRAVIGVRIALSIRMRAVAAPMRAHSKPSVPRLDADASKSSSAQPRFLAWRFLDFAPPTAVAPQPNNAQTWSILQGGKGNRAIGVLIHRQLLCFTPPKLSKTDFLPSNTTACPVLLTMPPRLNVPRYETQLPKKTATSDLRSLSVQQVPQVSTTLCPSLHPLYHKTRSAAPFLAQSTKLMQSKLSVQPTLTKVPTSPGL
ncbi:hypothetical protein ARMGADRAFT_1169732 [Armillaria gallica]|uniref:Uncharacterized protein n=1 Tax=Armillaria gallica TaxID=47427 RepID=A0A2H3CTF1_ARMGA|nr:hypothetical protein ARMGADRAFT_1169732 [Armillaria gallica]